jgi:hypothetical protein
MENFYSAGAWAFFVGGIPMIFAISAASLLVATLISFVLTIALFGALLRLTIAQHDH